MIESSCLLEILYDVTDRSPLDYHLNAPVHGF